MSLVTHNTSHGVLGLTLACFSPYILKSIASYFWFLVQTASCYFY